MDASTFSETAAKVVYMGEDFKARMKRIRVRAGYKSQSAAADAIGCDRGNVGMWEAPSSPVQSVGQDWLFQVARAYRVRAEWINDLSSENDGFNPDGAPHISIPETAAGYVRFQLMEGAAGMGAGVVNQDYPEVIRDVEVAEWEVRRKIGYLPEPGQIALLTGRGPSMRPQIDHGDVVMVDTRIRAFDGDGVYVINLGGETQIKMLQMRVDGIYVVSANADYPAFRVDHVEDIHVGGRVVSVLGIREL